MCVGQESYELCHMTRTEGLPLAALGLTVTLWASAFPGILLIGFLGTIQQLALNYGARTVSAGAVSFLVGTVPIFTALLAITFLGERLCVWGWTGILTSFCGIGLLGLAEGEGVRFAPGALFVILASLAESLMIVLMKPQQFPLRPNIPIQAMSAGPLGTM